MKKWIKRILLFLLGLLALAVVWVGYNLRDRQPGYSLEIDHHSAGSAVQLRVGFAKKVITPTILDQWTDNNDDAKYDPEDGDTYQDLNGNGKFDPVWIAGFSQGKPANGIHDHVWARTVVMDDGNFRLALVSLDAIGFMHDDVVDIRSQLPPELGVDYLVVASTHTHESNDLIGMWGPDIMHSGVDKQHMKWLKEQVLLSVTAAVAGMRPADLVFAQDVSGRDSLLIKDTRKPIVKATGISVLQAIDSEVDTTLGTLVNWANHPETLWSKNLLISSDFPHYIRKSLEQGIFVDEEEILPPLGGISIFFNGAVGGLMTPHPSLAFHDPIRDTVLSEPSFEKTQTLGEQIALLAASALEQGDTLEKVRGINVQAQTIALPLDNRNFKIASAIGLLNRGTTGWFQSRTEVAIVTLGPLTMVSIPGEIYPEIVYGGIESPPGQDFDISPMEIPPLNALIQSKYFFILGLSNDEIGYIIPKSEWDDEEPWLYLDEGDTYGEENSLGPETGPLIYQSISDLLIHTKR